MTARHLAVRPDRHWRRWTAAIALVGLLTSVQSLASPRAAAETDRLVQAVEVKVSSDGTVTSIASTSISGEGDEDPQTSGATFDPSETADDLPVRVLTSYRMGAEAGTDLEDLRGKAGRVVIDVTVQNTTVRPEFVEYGTADGAREVPALIGSPLTVVGAVELDGGLSRVVSGGPDGPSTNGVVSRRSGGGTSVQWATYLAPPRLAPSATFRLVQDTPDFEPPTFDISVQPGLVTDVSIERLVNDVFGSGSTSVAELDAQTIELIDKVNLSLVDASTALSAVQLELDNTGKTLGSRTVAELRVSQAQVESELTGLIAALEQLESQATSEFEAGGDTVSGLVAAVVDDLRATLGDPRNPPAPLTPVDRDGCLVDQGTGDEPGTVYGQIYRVSEYLKFIANSAEDCQQVLVAGLDATLGQYRTVLATADNALIANRDAIIDELDSAGTVVKDALLGELEASIGSVTAIVEDLSAASASARGAYARFDVPLTQLLGALRNLRGLTADSGPLSDALAEIRLDAEAQIEEIGGGDGILAQLDEATGEVCDAGSDEDSDAAGAQSELLDPLDDIADLLTGLTCGGRRGDSRPSVAERLDDVQDALEDIADSADTSETDPGSVLILVDRLVGRLIRSVNLVLTRDSADIDSGAEALDGDLQTIAGKLNGAYSATLRPPIDPVDCSGNRPGVRVVNQLLFDLDVLKCKKGLIDQDLGALKSDVVTGYADVHDAIDSANSDAEVVNQAGDDALTALLGEGEDGLVTQLRATKKELRGNVRKTVADQRRKLQERSLMVDSQIEDAVGQVVASLSDQVGQSNANTEATRRQLVAGLIGVLTNIGENREGGTGLLGQLSDSAADTGTQNAVIVNASEDAAAFGSVRTQSLADLELQHQQVLQSLALAELFPAFGLDIPDGSVTGIVFTFHVGGDA
ncbi:hypothetical protein F0U44_05625 [Nocardioides humilatus]|uniref:Uncharacterized protein n=1 Tax=Nocardioides humilatus TaxID=2607660 RepID=A0A5B1LPP4_9ACTN|nr:hypothetical protein [Nocardioides humilatus]KAA1421750.1 hypothetical protein F0U44_05625 [Nocardioides humilatus]